MSLDFIYCPNCGFQLPINSSYCGRCGYMIPSESRGQIPSNFQVGQYQGYDQPHDTISLVPNTVANRPSYFPTLIVTFFGGVLGLIPAIRHSQMAKARGYSQSRYWWIFGGILGTQITLSILLSVLLLLIPVNNATGTI